MTVADVLAGGLEGYAGRVEQWARSIVGLLDEIEARPGKALHQVQKAVIFTARPVHRNRS
jgi:hypothetical protein